MKAQGKILEDKVNDIKDDKLRTLNLKHQVISSIS